MGLSLGQILRDDALPGQGVLKELLNGGVVGAVNGKAQGKNLCRKFVEVSVFGTIEHA